MLEQLIKSLHKPKSDFKQLFVLWEISPDTTEYIVDASNDHKIGVGISFYETKVAPPLLPF